MDKDKLVELAERCEAAAGPDRELDREICLGIRNGRWISPDAIPSYTASLDAAMTLVPEGAHWEVGQCEGKSGATVSFDAMPNATMAATVALALCAAALRSHAPK